MILPSGARLIISLGGRHSLIFNEAGLYFAGPTRRQGVFVPVVLPNRLPIRDIFDVLATATKSYILSRKNGALWEADASMQFRSVPPARELQPGEQIVRIFGGPWSDNVFFLTDNQRVFGRGSNIFGALGRGVEHRNLADFSLVPTPAPAQYGHIVKMAVGDEHTLALTNRGEVLGCGRVQESQLGATAMFNEYLSPHDHTPVVRSLVPILDLDGDRVTDIFVGTQSSFIDRERFGLCAAGKNVGEDIGYRQSLATTLGFNRVADDRFMSIPRLPGGVEGVNTTCMTVIAPAADAIYGLTSEHDIVSFSDDGLSLLNLNSPDTAPVFDHERNIRITPMEAIPPFPPHLTQRAVLLTSGAAHVAFVTNEGRIFMKGDNLSGQIGCGIPDETIREFREIHLAPPHLF
jgi:hypothetical protein